MKDELEDVGFWAIISPQLKGMMLLKSGCIFWSLVSWDAPSGALALPVSLDQLLPSKNMWVNVVDAKLHAPRALLFRRFQRRI